MIFFRNSNGEDLLDWCIGEVKSIQQGDARPTTLIEKMNFLQERRSLLQGKSEANAINFIDNWLVEVRKGYFAEIMNK